MALSAPAIAAARSSDKLRKDQTHIACPRFRILAQAIFYFKLHFHLTKFNLYNNIYHVTPFFYLKGVPMKYEVKSSREDIAEHNIGSFSADSDDEAKRIFLKEYVANPNNSWNHLRLIQVAQERIERHIETSDPSDCRKK